MNNSDYAAWLYGSYARLDYNVDSDIDILLVGKTDIDTIISRTNYDRNKISLSQYNWIEMKKMSSYGSLFLHHLKLEGKLLSATDEGKRRCEDILGSLVHYKHTNRDIRAFEKCIEDVEIGIDKGSTPAFEMSVLATVLRHSAVLACYLLGNQKFGRLEPFQFASKHWHFEDSIINGFEELYQFRLHEDGRTSLPFEATEKDVSMWVGRVKRFLTYLKREAYAHEKRVFGTN
jgi:hypothetical protein